MTRPAPFRGPASAAADARAQRLRRQFGTASGPRRRGRSAAWIAWAGVGLMAVVAVIIAQRPPTPTAAGERIHFASCKAMRAAGMAPAGRRSPAYSAHLDADGDGVACEPWVGAP